jgi:hypothetical protein
MKSPSPAETQDLLAELILFSPRRGLPGGNEDWVRLAVPSHLLCAAIFMESGLFLGIFQIKSEAATGFFMPCVQRQLRRNMKV